MAQDVKKGDLKKRAAGLLKSAEEVLMQSASMAAGFKDAEDFKRSLLADLKSHEGFDEAAREFHELHSAQGDHSEKNLKKLSASRKLVTGGRVQASRFEASHKRRAKP